MNDRDIQELRQAAEKATPGPWVYQEDSDAYTHIVRQGNELTIHGWICSAGQSSSIETESTARFIAAASPDRIIALTDLLSQCLSREKVLVEALTWVLNDLQEWCDSIGEDASWDSWDHYYKSFQYGGIDKIRAVLKSYEEAHSGE